VLGEIEEIYPLNENNMGADPRGEISNKKRGGRKGKLVERGMVQTTIFPELRIIQQGGKNRNIPRQKKRKGNEMRKNWGRIMKGFCGETGIDFLGKD